MKLSRRRGQTIANPLGPFLAPVAAFISCMWLTVTCLIDSGIVKGDATVLNPVSWLMLGVIFGVSIQAVTKNGIDNKVNTLEETIVDQTCQIAILTAQLATFNPSPVVIDKAAVKAVTVLKVV